MVSTIVEYKKPSPQPARRSIWSLFGFSRNDQVSVEKELALLKNEIAGVEERESSLQARLDHLDNVLRSSQFAGYLHTRMRWTPLPGEPPCDETDVNDWSQGFLAISNSSLNLYLQAADLRPQITIQMPDIVEVAQIPSDMHHQGDCRWFAFHVTTNKGLRLECSTLLKYQMDAWLAAIDVNGSESQAC